MTKADAKFIKQLQKKKYRKIHRAFVVEGLKSILDFIKAGYQPVKIYTKKLYDNYLPKDNSNVEIITPKQLKQISFLQHPKDALAVFKINDQDDLPQKGLIIALDDLQDPGNLGTIIRTADWFGIRHIVCSENTVDCYNPKVVQATMGSLANVNVSYTDLHTFLKQTSLPIFGTFLEGNNIYKTRLPKEAIVVIGNEGKGISKEIGNLTKHKIYIPKAEGSLAESLNASVAAAIVLNEFSKLKN